MSSDRSPLRAEYVALAAFCALAVASYWRILNGWFLSDDGMIGMVIPDGEHVAWKHVLAVFHGDWGLRGPESELRYYRPLVIVSQAIDAALWGVSPLGFHLTNALLHGLNGYLVRRVARGLGAGTGAALVAGTAFVLFPWHAESVAWISGRTDVLCATFMFASVALYLEARPAVGVRRRRLLAGSLAAFALALLSKEPAVTLPLVVVGLDLTTDCDFRSPWRSVRRLLPAWCAFGLVALGYLGLRVAILGNVWGGKPSTFYGTSEKTFDTLRENWRDNLTLLLSPFNRSALEDEHGHYVRLCIAAGVALAAAVALAIRGRRFEFRLVLAAVAGFVAVVAPFASALHVPGTLENARYFYVATAFFCLLLGVLAMPSQADRPSLAPPLALVGVLALLLQANLTPWVEASDVMRRVTHTYASTFGMGSGERIERLPARHHGVYMALYNVDGFSPQFLPGKRPKLQAVVESRAAYFGLERNMRMLPDPVFGSADRLEADRTTAEWLFPVDGSALDAASLEGLERVPGVPSGRQFRTLGRASWLITRPPADQPPLSHAPGSEEVAYLLIRPAPPDAPNLFWSAEDEPFGDPRWVVLEREMALQDGRVAPRAVNGFAVYAYPLHEHRYWPGMERITSLRLDPHFSTEPFEIGFFGIARRK